MRNIHFHRPRPGTTIAFVALTVALSGTAVALPGSNTVTSGDIKNKQVKSADLASNAVTSAKVKDGKLLAKDFKAGQLPAGAKGDKGDKGDPGTPGQQGPIGPSNVRRAVNNVPQPWTVGLQQLVNIDLPAGNWAVTATALLNNDDTDDEVTVPCELRHVATVLADLGPGIRISQEADGFGDRASITLQGTISLPAAGVVSLQCAPGTTLGNYQRSNVQAIQVGTIAAG